MAYINKVDGALHYNIDKVLGVSMSNVAKVSSIASSPSMEFTVVYGAGGDFTLPINGGGAGYTHNFVVDWGDSSVSTITAFDDADRIHTYAGAGTYKVRMFGTCEWFAFADGGDKVKVTTIDAFRGDIGLKVLNFYGCTALTSTVALGTKAALTTASSMFRGCTSLNNLPSDLFDGCSAITTFSYAFNSC